MICSERRHVIPFSKGEAVFVTSLLVQLRCAAQCGAIPVMEYKPLRCRLGAVYSMRHGIQPTFRNEALSDGRRTLSVPAVFYRVVRSKICA